MASKKPRSRTRSGRPNIQKLAQQITRALKRQNVEVEGGYRTVVKKVRELVDRYYPSYRGKPTVAEIKREVILHFGGRPGATGATSGKVTPARRAPYSPPGEAFIPAVIPAGGKGDRTRMMEAVRERANRVRDPYGTVRTRRSTGGKPFNEKTATDEVIRRLKNRGIEVGDPSVIEYRLVELRDDKNFKREAAIGQVVRDLRD